MAAHWYCLIGQQQYGPFTSEQIQQLVQQGQLQREHYVRTETDSQWTAAGDLPGLFAASQATANPPHVPSAAPRSKKKYLGPAAAPGPPGPAAGAVPQARPVSPPAAPVHVATHVSAAPIAAPTGTPLAVMPPAATPIAPVPPAAVPVAAVPVAEAAAATAAPAAKVSPPAAGRVGGKATSAARPIPLAPAVPPAAPPAPARNGGEVGHKRRGSRQKSQLLAGGLTAALMLLIVVAVVVMNRSPSKQPGERAGRATASAPGANVEPNSNPEVDPAAVVQGAAEPDRIADPPQAVAAIVHEPAAEPEPNPLPAVGKWLDATRQKGGLRDGARSIVRIGVERAWVDRAANKPAVLNVEVQISNRSDEEPLEFTGWRPDNQPQPDSQATMFDDAGAALQAATARPAAGRRAARRHVAPGESVTEQLSFVFPERDSKQFRLALPYAALGQTGYLGFELPRQMIKKGETDARETAEAKAAEPQSETLLPIGEAAESKPGEPETIGDLRSEIERGREATNEATDEPMKPAADEPPAPVTDPQPEPEKTPDIRKLLEEEDRKAEAKDESQPNANKMDN
ncbi:MAG TPA: DUF4339 domain-containing protein [Candidatus Anammoximicrobium sp.]|nr:DUF4339 domain-containing protein [Candidatus Anammoximicrobium sp.]